jgi:hypothetical protein
MNILSEHFRDLRNAFAILLVCISTNLVGCAGGKTGAPPPPPRPLLAEIPPVPHSTLRVPIEVDLDFLGGKVLASVPRPLSQGVQRKRVQLGGGLPFAPSVGVEFRHRAELEALDLRLDGDQLQAVARVGFAVGGSVVGSGMNLGLASCGERIGEPSPAIEFTLRGALSWGDDAKIRLRQAPWEMRWVRPCELTAFKVRLEDLLDLPLVREKVQGAVTQAVQRIPEAIQLRPMAEKAWKAMAQPRRVLPGLLLLVRPDSVTASPLGGSGKTMQAVLTVFAQPVLTDSLSPSDTLKPLPPIRIAPPAGDAFQLEAVTSVPLAVVDSLLSATLSGRTFDAGGRVVKIAKARLYGGGDRAILGVTLVRPFAGEIFLKGRPMYDSAAGTVRLSEVDFDLQTRSFLTKTADFLLHGTIKDAIAKAAVFDISKFLPRLADLRIPTGDVGEAAISLQRLRPMAISLDKDHLRAWLGAEGRAVYKVGARHPTPP